MMVRPSIVLSFLFNLVEMIDQLVVHLILCANQLLKVYNLVYEDFVCIQDTIVRFLKLLDLLLRCGQRLAEDENLLVGNAELLVGCLRFPRSRGFSSDIIQIILPVSSKLGVLKLPCLCFYQLGHSGHVFKEGKYYRCAVWRLSVLVIMPDFVEVVFIKLPYKAGKVAVLEVFGQNRLGEPFILRC